MRIGPSAEGAQGSSRPSARSEPGPQSGVPRPRTPSPRWPRPRGPYLTRVFAGFQLHVAAAPAFAVAQQIVL